MLLLNRKRETLARLNIQELKIDPRGVVERKISQDKESVFVNKFIQQ